MATRKKKSSELEAQADPTAPLNGNALLAAAKPVLAKLNEDLLQRADASKGITEALQVRHAAEVEAERSADNYSTWRRNFIEQVAAAWFLSVVFVRTLEDRGLIERNRIAGEGALDSQKSFFTLAPSLSEREYLLTVFRELSHLPAAAALFDPAHNPVWLLTPSAEATQALLQLFRTPNDTAPAFRFGGDARFLGDLYQDLSENVRKRYALLQTPRFVESFILDQTLEPAIARFGLDAATLIDPTCGSGHFLLGAFERLLEHRLQAEPGVDVRQAAGKALEAVAGSDINPYAVSIARFRLTLSFLERAGYRRLKEAPRLPLHVVVADSLLHNPQKGLEGATGDSAKYQQRLLGEQVGTDLARWEGSLFELEDPKLALEVLGKRYAAVVGNPPYITVKDAKLRDRYRAMYANSAAGKYSLAAPFCERFFQLGREGALVGMITANSFMKREFGKKLIQDYLPGVNLTSILNTSGAYIPGHGTPTVLLFGTAEKPVESDVLTVLASRGEPSTPEDAEQGLVWRSIADHFSEVGFENEYISVARTERAQLANHPWSLGGGGATDLKELLEERSEKRLGEVAEDIGFASFTGLDDAFIVPRSCARTLGLADAVVRDMVVGEQVRDWCIATGEVALTPYSKEDHSPLALSADAPWARFLWRYRTVAENVASFGGKTRKEEGQNWWEWYRWQKERYEAPFRITFAFVATHNHFVLDRGGKVFKQSAPIIKLPESATEDDHYALLAYLNSSTACFWMKQVCHNKTNASQKHSTDPARAAYEFAGTALGDLPVFAASEEVTAWAREASELGAQRANWLSGVTFRRSLASVTSRSDLEQQVASGWAQYDRLTERMVVLQEDIDWAFYEKCGLATPSSRDKQRAPEAVPLGARPFEAQTGYDSGVSERATTKNSERAAILCPPAWQGRVEQLGNDSLRRLEAREFKRMWRDTERNVDQAEFREGLPSLWLRTDVLDQLEARFDGKIRTPAFLAAAVASSRTEAVADYLGTTPLGLAAELLTGAAIPFIDALVYTNTGLEKRQAWHGTWDLQRREDIGELVTPGVPPKYSQGSRGKSKDFVSDVSWQLRGELDVPKERFISYPGCESDQDREPVYGWAGWDHRQRAVALATLYTQRKSEEGWKKNQLQPMLAGLLELLPWLKQWHNQPDQAFDGAIPAQQFQDFLDAECAEHGFTYDDLKNWRPTKSSKKTASKKPPKQDAAQ